MAERIEGWRSRDGSVHASKRGAVLMDLMHEVDDRSNSETDLPPLAASIMAENPTTFIRILEQMLEED